MNQFGLPVAVWLILDPDANVAPGARTGTQGNNGFVPNRGISTHGAVFPDKSRKRAAAQEPPLAFSLSRHFILSLRSTPPESFASGRTPSAPDARDSAPLGPRREICS
jgi:hypothetical protein